MMRWLWRLRSDRGGQHAEAGVLIAGLIMLGGAVTVGSVPQLSTAVADQWVCNISNPDSARCGGPVDEPVDEPVDDEPTDTRGRKLQQTTYAASTTAGSSADPAASHEPRQEKNSGEGGSWFVKGVGSVLMDSCTNNLGNCTDGTGQYYECTITSSSGPFGVPLTQKSCSTTITPATPLVCGDEGRSPTYETCLGPDQVILHCTSADASGNRLCTNSDHDADAQMPGLPVSCGQTTDSGATCMGSNGTLYQCPSVKESGQCEEGGRNIYPEDPALTDCVPIVSHGDTTGQVVRCTYTPSSCSPQPASGSCADQAVSVRCMKDLPTDSNVEYQHCQSLGEIVPDGSTLSTVCLVETAGSCTTSTNTVLSPPTAADDIVATTELGPLDVEIGDDYTKKLSIATGEVDENGEKIRKDMSHQELTEFCQTHATQCDGIARATEAATKTKYVELLQHLGLCDDTAGCAETYDAMKLGASGGPNTGRTLQALPLSKVQLTALGLFGAAGLTSYGSTYVENEKVKVGVQSVAASMAFLGTILFGVDAYRGNLAGQTQGEANTGFADQLSALEAGQRATETELAFAAQERITLMLENQDLRGQLAGLREQIDDPGVWRQFRSLFGGS